MKTDALTKSNRQGPPSKHCMNGNRKTWSALFEPDAELYDDGRSS